MDIFSPNGGVRGHVGVFGRSIVLRQCGGSAVELLCLEYNCLLD